jgi:hypothetical protein
MRGLPDGATNAYGASARRVVAVVRAAQASAPPRAVNGGMPPKPCARRAASEPGLARPPSTALTPNAASTGVAPPYRQWSAAAAEAPDLLASSLLRPRPDPP